MTPETVTQALAILRADEGSRKYAYDDATGARVRAPEGNLTIGCGINLDAGLDDDAIDWLERHAFAREWGALRHSLLAGFDVDALPQKAELALGLMAFQLGAAKVLTFRRLLAAVKRRHWDDAAAEALASKWEHQTAARAERVADLFRDLAEKGRAARHA